MFGLRALGALPYTGRPETAVSGVTALYRLSFTGNSYVQIASTFSVASNSSLSIKFRASFLEGTISEIYGLNAGIGERLQYNGTGFFFRLNGGNGNTITTATIASLVSGYSVSNANEYELRKILFEDGSRTRYRLYVNGIDCGVLLSIFGSGGDTFQFNRIGSASTAFMNGDLYYFDCFVDGVKVRSYDPSGISGGNILVDKQGGNDGTLTGFNLGNCWRPYLDTTVSNALVPQPVSGAIKWYLNNTASPSAAVTIPYADIGASVGNYVEIKAVAFAGNPTGYYRLLSDNNSGWNTILEMQPTALFFKDGINSNTITAGYTQPPVGSVFTLRITRASSTTWQLSLNGSNLGSPVPAGAGFTINTIGRLNNSATEAFRGGYYYVAISTNGGVSATRYYDPSVGNGGSSTLIDTIGGQHGAYVGDWVTGTRYMPYLDTTVSTPIVSQGVNGTANYFCTLNGTSGFTAPTLGNLLTGSPKIKIISKKFSTPTNGTYALYSQCGVTSSSREFVFRTNANGNIELFIGGSSTYICTVAEAITAFGSSTLACEEFAFELNGTTARLFKDGVAVITKTGVVLGATRINNALFRIGNQGATDSPLDTTGTTFAANGTTIGDTQVYINDVLVRNYKMPDNGSLVTDTVNAGTNFLKFSAGTNTYVYCDLKVPTQNSGRALQVEYEDEFEARRTSTDFPVVSTHVSSATDLIFLKSGSDVEIRSTGNSNWIVTTGVDLTQFHVFRFRTTFNGTVALRELYIDGVFIASTTLTQAPMGVMNAFASLSSGTSRAGDLKYYKRTDFVTPANNRLYDARIGNGVDPVLYEAVQNTTVPLNTANYSWEKQTVAVQRGTFTIDNSEWRQYIENIVSAVTAKVIKWFNGTAWVSKPIKWFNGTAWVQKTFKR